MRRTAASVLLLAAAGLAASGAAAARAEPAGAPRAQAVTPVVDVVEVFGVLDGQLAGYVLDRISEANRAGAALLVLELDTPGALEVDVREIVAAIRSSAVPVAVWIGPRRARAASGGALLVAAAPIAGIGPSARLGPLHPFELSVDPDSAPGRHARGEEAALAAALASERGRGDPAAFAGRSLGANASLDARAVDLITPSVKELLERSDGRTVTTGAGSVTLRLKSDEVVVRFLKPGPIRGMLHTFANPSLVYVLALAAAMLLVFEAFQPGFGVAGGTGVVLLAGAVYGLTILPVSALGLGLLGGGLGLLAVDVAVHGLGVPTIAGTGLLLAGSVRAFPAPAGALGLPGWVTGIGVASSLVFFVPVMTFVRRSRVDPTEQRAVRELIGQPGHVRSMLNPEGFVWVADALWRARSEDGSRMRVGEDVLVVGVEGALLRVRRP